MAGKKGSTWHGKTMEQRFWAKVAITAQEDRCWEWLAARNEDGYGIFRVSHDQSMERSHRIAFKLTKGNIPEGYEPDHTCRNRGCANFHHLELVTHQVNVLRGNSPAAIAARKMTCSEGHPFDGQQVRATGKRQRICLTCKELYMKNWYQKRGMRIAPRNKLAISQVRDITALLIFGISYSSIAKLYQLKSKGTISRIAKKKGWRNVIR